MRNRLFPFALVALATVVTAACSSSAGGAGDGDGRITVVTTMPLIRELAMRVGGDDIEVVNLIPLGVDEHAYQPGTAVPRDVARASLVLVNGYRLEETLLDIIVENVRPAVPVVAVSRELVALEGGDDHEGEDGDHEHEDAHGAGGASAGAVDDLVFADGDPHFWLDARNVAGYAATIRDALIQVDPARAEAYRERAAGVIGELEALHEELVEAMAVIPAERRQIIVFHDAFQYFAAAYDFRVVASVAPSNPNQATSAAAIAEIIRIVRSAGVPTIYREPQYSGQVLDLIAADASVTIGVLHSILTADAPTYAEMMRVNARQLVEGLAREP